MQTPTLLVRGHLKGVYLLLTVIFLGFIYFTAGVSFWLLIYPFLSLLIFYGVFLRNDEYELNFFSKVLIFLNPIVLGAILLYFLNN